MSQHPPMSQHPSGDAPRRQARDLAIGERGVAAWVHSLERHDAPAELRAQILEGGHDLEEAGAGRPAGRLLQLFPLGGWGLASAALLLFALGTATWVEISDAQAVPPASAQGGAVAADAAAPVSIIEDPSMALFHDVEIFDEVGLARGELIADWGR